MVKESRHHAWQIEGKKAVCKKCGEGVFLPVDGGLMMEGCPGITPEEVDNSSVKYMSDYDPTRTNETARQAIKRAMKQNTSGEGGFAGDKVFCFGVVDNEDGTTTISSTEHGFTDKELIFALGILEHIYKERFLR